MASLLESATAWAGVICVIEGESGRDSSLIAELHVVLKALLAYKFKLLHDAVRDTLDAPLGLRWKFGVDSDRDAAVDSVGDTGPLLSFFRPAKFTTSSVRRLSSLDSHTNKQENSTAYFL
jgi:hypothetical protein